MSQITICGDCYFDATIVSNQFIDYYMKDANDAQIKIYLHLLRCNNGNLPVSVSLIADCFNYTEKDVIRALKYWEQKKLLSLSFSNTKLEGIKLLPLEKPKQESPKVEKPKVFVLPAKPSYSLDRLAAFKNQEDISQLLFIAEQYLGKTLSTNEVSSILYMYDSLDFNADLIEYLIEYCVNNKKKSIRFIETVANSWAAAGIHTVAEARARTSFCPKEVYEVFKAFGITTGRSPVEPEIAYVRKWTDSFAFSMDIITEACSRTIMTAHTPSFEYADTILTNWSQSGVKHLADIERLDKQYHTKAAPVKNISGTRAAGVIAKEPAGANKFNNFSQRTYNYSELEQEILSN